MPEIDMKGDKSGWLTDVLVALSIANLLLFKVWMQLIYAGGRDLYYLPIYTWQSYFAMIILLLALGAPFLFALRKLRTSEGVLIRLISIATLAVYASLLIYNVILMFVVFGFPTGIVVWTINVLKGSFNVIFVFLLILLCCFGFLAIYFRRALVVAVYVALLIFSPLALLNVAHATYEYVALALKPPATFEKLETVKKHTDNDSRGKTILLIFDGFDYRIAFEKMAGGELKNLDYLKRNSLFFTTVASIFWYTQDAIPSLVTGHRVKAGYKLGELYSPYDLGLIFEHGSGVTSWRETETLFSKFSEEGYSVALIGAYHAYCTVFRGLVDYCKSYSSIDSVEIAPSSSVFQSLVKQAFGITPFSFFRILNFIEVHKEQERQTIEAATNDVLDFVYAHFFVPHRPYIYDRASGLLTISDVVKRRIKGIDGEYIDNLQLVDITLGKIIDKMKEENVWDTSTLIVTSDHHFRTDNPHDIPSKIPLLVKLPMQNKMHVSDARLSLLHIKPMIEKIVFDGISDPVELSREFEDSGE